MRKPAIIREVNRTDTLVAMLTGLVSLAIYIRTLGPDILYGDSAEFQTLAYTLGITHSTGYPIYLFMGRLVGFLPVGNLAWRVNLVSAICAAFALAGVYLLVRYFTNNRAASLLASACLAVSYTFWSQAILAEVYCPSTACLVWILVLLFRWQNAPQRQAWALFFAGFLAGLSPGIHATAAFAAPACLLFVLWTAWQRRSHPGEWKRTFLYGAGGTMMGVMIYFLAFLFTSLHNPPSSFINVMYVPNRSFWNLSIEEVKSIVNQFRYTVGALQWHAAFNQGGSDAAVNSFGDYLLRFLASEFSVWMALFMFFGWSAAFQRKRDLAALLSGAFGVIFIMVINYHPGDQYVFFLPTYALLVVTSGAGMGALFEWSSTFLKKRLPPALQFVLLGLMIGGVGYLLLKPHTVERWEALRTGVASFVQDEYNFPVNDLQEPRRRAKMMLLYLPDNALALMDWRELYTTYYLAVVEGKKSGIKIVEAMPTGNNGKVATSLIEMVQTALQDGQPVYSQHSYPDLQEHFRLLPVGSSDWYSVRLRRK